jgi:cytoskeletal protein CcmA (bactofilin family)
VFQKVIGQKVSDSPSSAQPAVDPRSSSESVNFGSDRASSSASKPAASTRNVLSSDVEIKGIVKFQHDLIVDGKIEGDIQSTGNLTIGENARIKAEVKTGSVIVYGKVHGNLTAVDRVELKSSAEVVGDIKAKILTIEAGAIFVGKSTVGTPSQSSPTQPELKPIANQAATNQAAAVETQPLLAEK